MSVVIATHLLSDKVVRELIAGGLSSAASDANQPLTDPQAASRAGKAPFVMTSFPSQNALFPHVVVAEANRIGGRIDPAAGVSRYDYSTRIGIHVTQVTNLFSIRDGILHWAEDQFVELGTAGFSDPRVVSSTSTTWDPTSRTKDWEIVLQGTVHTAPNFTP